MLKTRFDLLEHHSTAIAQDQTLDVVLDTDTFNEIDDQFAVIHALRSPERIRLLGLYAAPFRNATCPDPGQGMQQSYDEIIRLLERLPIRPEVPVLRGSQSWMSDVQGSVPSAARDHLIDLAMSRDVQGPPLYVAAIGAPTNVASALQEQPELASRVVVVWLGGHERTHPSAREFNLEQDIAASRWLLNSGCALIRVPCIHPAQKLRTTLPELRHHLTGRNPVCDFLLDRVEQYADAEEPTRRRANAGRAIAYGKEIWDVAVTAWLIDPAWVPTVLRSSPILSEADDWQWSEDPHRHLIREAVDIDRDAILGDLFSKLASIEK